MGEAEHKDISGKIDQVIEMQRAHQERLTNIDDLLRGTYKDEGLITRVSSLEKTEASRICWYRLTIGAAVTSAVGAVISWIKHGGAS